jgi:hypothetical protein
MTKRFNSQNYAVGYRRPPAKSRFKAGKSGNPNGRPKGARSADSLLKELLNEKVKIREGDKIRSITRLEAMFRSVLVQAMKGNSKAMNSLLSMYREVQGNEPPEATTFIVQFNDKRAPGAGPRVPHPLERDTTGYRLKEPE